MKRVNEGEKYWCIEISMGVIEVVSYIDNRYYCDNRAYETGNYYCDKDEAESVANKISAVFKGIKMIESSKAVLAFNDFLGKLKNDGIISYNKGCKYMKEFQSKIIK